MPALLALLLLSPACPAPPRTGGPRTHATQAGPRTDLERRTYLLLEDRCLVDNGAPCSWSDELAQGAGALVDLLRREGRDALRQEQVIRAELQRAGLGHPNLMAAALFYSGREPAAQDIESFVAGIRWSFPARTFGVAQQTDEDLGTVGDAVAGMLVIVGAEPLVELDPPPRWLPQEADVTFEGWLLPGSADLRVLLSPPDGAIREAPLATDDDGRFAGDVHIGPTPGRYVFELLAEQTAVGPRVVYLLPIELSLEPPVPETGPGPATSETTDPVAAVEKMTALVQQFRAEEGLGGLRRDAPLDGVAQAHATDMATADFFGHSSPTRGDLPERLRAAGITYPRAAENLAVGSSAEAAFASLLESPAHRANFLDPTFTLFGVAAAKGGDSLLFAVELATGP
jgi:uncharacterized protein YkwD